EPIHVNLLKLDLTKVRLDVAHAMDAAIGLEKTSSIAARYGALAAINAGFFRLDNSIFRGDATGVLVIDGKLFSESYESRTALAISNQAARTEIAFEKLKSEIPLEFNKGYIYPIGINRQRTDDDFVIYTPEFHRTTLTSENGTEIVVRRNKVIGVSEGKGSSLIPAEGFVLSLSGSYLKNIKKLPKIGAKIKYSGAVLIVPASQRLNTAFNEDIVGGVPQLIKNGKIEITWQEEKSSKAFVETRHPRTAVAKLKDGKFLMVTVDGRQAGYSVGMNLNELAAFLLELGAAEAMNLDGGGSTTMFLDGKVVNKPSDKEGERSVSDAILVFPRKRN
ncbi:MAG TPA: phosphodiester glycosidase family protein, partial [Pyrinomonadaceae bacterium]